jgi:ArsR family transcriptional regulator, arsenate/arsenite/antimonite-responsive transcriptional repressor
MGMDQRTCCTTLPAPIEANLREIGGIEGLRMNIPSREELAKQTRIYHALSDPLRMMILHVLKTQPLCVCVIREILGIADSKLSYHLTILRKSGLIESEQQGNWIIYRITDIAVKYL